MRNTKGFTLIELMIVVVVIGILAAIAFPSYQESVRKARRADAKSALLATAQMLERCFTEFNAYNNIAGCLIIDDDGGGNAEIDLSTDDDRLNGDGYYTITDVGATLTATAYTIQATPTDVGGQNNDTFCASFTLTHEGVKDSTNHPQCWQ